MIHFLNLFLLDTVKYLAVLTLGLFSIIFIIENGAVLNVDIIEKYQYYFIVGASLILINRIRKHYKFIVFYKIYYSIY
jgi:hypothetical protein